MLLLVTYNMGWSYSFYRIKYEISKRTGYLKRKFPTEATLTKFITLEEWKKNREQFFFNGRDEIKIPLAGSDELPSEYHDILDGKIIFFNSIKYNLGKNYNWITNPENGFNYNINKHWSDIPDFSKELGDIKFTWEKSRFSYLYTIIRYDQKYNCDSSKFVFNEINSWIDSNPLNRGPNYVSSQEISLRILNWIFALYYYKDSDFLTEDLFQVIIDSIYRQIDHVYKFINFSRKTVRNNHAITETLSLYLVGLLFPFCNNSAKWKADGKKWFEEEINYQIYNDGTYLQFSMNYHRVVIQLLTWAFYLSELNDDSFSQSIHSKAAKSIEFLLACQNNYNGELPNYGANDGSLFLNLMIVIIGIFVLSLMRFITISIILTYTLKAIGMKMFIGTHQF